MKKSELKALIKECINEMEDNKNSIKLEDAVLQLKSINSKIREVAKKYGYSV